MAQSLTRALEGITFPCDRAQLIEYARLNKASSKALTALEAVPHRKFANMTEVLSAVPSKTEMRRRPMFEEAPFEEAPEVEIPEIGAESGNVSAEPVSRPTVEAQAESSPSFPYMLQPPNLADQSAWLRLGAEWSAAYLRMWRRLWSSWLQG